MKKNKIYFVGIKGVGMTATAIYAKEKGAIVAGSDVKDVFLTDRVLSQNRIKVKEGFYAENVTSDMDTVVVTGAHGGMNNIEAKKAKSLGLKTYMQGQYLGQVMKDSYAISVAGCHGKTTTSAMIAVTMYAAGLDPSYIIGAPAINGFGPAGHFSAGKFFVAEADEYLTCPATCRIPRFLWQYPNILVITNIDYDHPDAYKNLEEVKEVYLKLIKQVAPNGWIIVCLDDPNIASMIPQIPPGKLITYGFSKKADYMIKNAQYKKNQSRFSISFKDQDLPNVVINASGKHNVQNALAAIITLNKCGVSLVVAGKYLAKFKGTKRRLEFIYQKNEMLLFDDYAHHPSEIRSTIEAVKKAYPTQNIIVIFQPHTYSRTISLMDDFSLSFGDAGQVIITDVFASARENKLKNSISGELVSKINKCSHNADLAPARNEVLQILKNRLTGKDIIVTMGAGDVYLWHKDIERLMNNL